ncbi:SusC/RagA family TonB-linked outer membrane protein [Hymenobacter chitinivorans]|uniref:TonB-linked SusC/RagA family outer membrane protein n=1 Tax=Hymenobacter chitinivorans DSM 11115 TaxID=1121954 RepID=A0A2M9BRZ0_9BACT|nr:TonB-dependent receptor [Hymenobacter chitinivorans]PJJ60716.1 TonB-linked SusC/RagA family outer membrane protein [Hymenobacter chitinivorans DSM 11115]
MKSFTLLAVPAAIVCLQASPSLAQSAAAQTVTGTVTDATDRSPLPGVTVVVKGTTVGASTDPSGQFTLSLSAGSSTLVVSAVGYETQTVNATGGAVRIALKADVKQLSEVVVTGYSEQNRKTLTSAISSVKGDALKDIPAASPDQLLQGKAPGVQVSANSGVPGGGIFIRIRGSNSVNASNDPLYVVDGVFINNTNLIATGLGNQVSSNPLADLNPQDIESIEILKDANATAIYGSRGANGVVLITTKRGKAGDKTRITFNTYHGWSKAAKQYDLVTGPELAQLENERFLNDGGNPAQLPYRSVASGGRGLPEEQPTFDRLSDVFRTAQTQSYELSAAGGSDKTQFYIGAGYFQQESIARPSAFDRFSLRVNLDNSVTDKLRIGTSTALARTHRNVSSNDNNPVGVINSALFPRTNLPVYNPDGSYAKYGSFDNHQALIDQLNNDAVGTRVISNVYGEYHFLKNLTLRSSWSIDFNDMYENNFNNTLILAGQPRGTASSYLSRDITLLNEQTLNYNVELGENHSLQALVGNTLQRNTFQRTSLLGQQFPGNDLTTIASAATQTGSSSRSQAGLVSFFGKATYSYKSRYTADVSVRADASSRFGRDNRWGYFPAVGLGWRLGEESFIQSLNVFQELKLRASVGKTGNQAGISDFAALGLVQGGANYLDLPGTAPLQLANPNLSWESTRQWNVGLDAAVLDNRLQLELNYYDKYTSGLLLNVPVPRKTGFASVVENYGAVSNKGFEAQATVNWLAKGPLQWSTTVNLARNVNKIQKLAAPITTGSRDIFRLEEGAPLYSFWLYHQTGVNPESGDAQYEDVNGDGQLTVADRQLVGNAWPNYFGGLTNSVTYKGVDFGFSLNFEQGAKIMNMNRFFLVHGGTQSNIGYLREQLDRWQHPGDQTDIPRLTTNAASNNYGGVVQNLSDRYLEDGSFLRLRTLTLGYTIPKETLAKARLNSVRIYVQAANLFTLTPYSGLDPEVNSQSGVSNTKNFDWATVPQPRTFQVGVTVGL